MARIRRSPSPLGLLLVSVFASGCLSVREQAYEEDETQRCAKCHGDPDREGDFLLKSAPPGDLARSTDASYPGVGAHMVHLLPSETHGAIECTECHEVPAAANTPGHADDELPAEIVFGSLAKAGDLSPHYNALARSCSDTWCHGEQEVSWRSPLPSDETCGSCHSLPPALPHPQIEDCSLCHGDVIDEEGAFVAPELHVDGTVQVESLVCSSCHGSDASPAPPPDLEGNTEPDAPGVGAHLAHLEAERSRPLECEECHLLPPNDSLLSHVDGTRAELVFSGVAETHGSAPHWDPDEASCSATWCHAPGQTEDASAPIWTTVGPLGCDGCHDTPPPAPHPPVEQCEFCHADVVSEGLRIETPALHVNGIVEVSIPEDCTSCHGGVNAAPPRDIGGNTAATFAGVGAHQIHVTGTELSRAVPCEECHVTVNNADDEGHFDTPLPAELAFSGVATSYGATPVYEEGRCGNSYCHGAHFQENRPSGGALTAPSWTIVDGSQAPCGSCHSLPPPLGHPQVQDCSSCHRNVRPDNLSFYNPSLHVNGIPETVLAPIP